MSKDRQFFTWPSNSNNCNILSNSICIPSFYGIVMIDDDSLSYDIFHKVVEGSFPQDVSKISNLFLFLKEKGSITFSQYTKDIAETKMAEILDYSLKNSFKIDVSLKKIL
ncbi:hypothetical protein GUI12_02780 [Anaplasmataceae bacterium AB001_6]|nr:hypothetical protein GUI12_02780 [Anaplasmataceae bacterium AB001_6]